MSQEVYETIRNMVEIGAGIMARPSLPPPNPQATIHTKGVIVRLRFIPKDLSYDYDSYQRIYRTTRIHTKGFFVRLPFIAKNILFVRCLVLDPENIADRKPADPDPAQKMETKHLD